MWFSNIIMWGFCTHCWPATRVYSRNNVLKGARFSDECALSTQQIFCQLLIVVFLNMTGFALNAVLPTWQIFCEVILSQHYWFFYQVLLLQNDRIWFKCYFYKITWFDKCCSGSMDTHIKKLGQCHLLASKKNNNLHVAW